MAFILISLHVAAAAPLSFTGTNISGGEFCHPKPGVPQVYGKDYIYPSVNEFNYFASKGMNVFRVPFRWEVLQPALMQPLDPADLSRLKAVAASATDRGLIVILDPHNYARYYNDVIGGPKVSDAAFADFWSRLSTEFKNNPRVWFGLMNEPHDMPTADWFNAAQAAVTAIRNTGAKNRILVPGNGWTGAHSWVQSGNDAMLKLTDPANNYIFEAHQYLDHDSSGTHPDVESATIGSERLTAFTDWCRRNHKQALLGEFGAASDSKSKAAVDDMLTFMEKSPDVWLGFTWWSAGAWWGKYMYSIEPDNLNDKPQMTYVLPHLHGVPLVATYRLGPPV